MTVGDKENKNEKGAGFPDNRLTSNHVRLFLRMDAYVEVFFLPVLGLCAFVAAAWSGLIDPLFPWAHGLALLVLMGAFLRALSRVQEKIANEPLFVSKGELSEQDLTEPEQKRLSLLNLFLQRIKGHYFEKASTQLKKHPVFLSYGCGAIVFLCLSLGWSAWGEAWLTSLNPSFGQEWRTASLPLTVWITPPSYTGLPPTIIATPSTPKQNNSSLEIVEGSLITVHAPGEGTPPMLQVNGAFYPLERDEHGDFGLTQKIEKGSSIAISRGWKSLGFWRAMIKADQPPRIAFTTKPVISERKTVQISYTASDDQMVSHVSLLIQPVVMTPLVKKAAFEVPLLAPEVPRIEETTFPDLTSSLLAGLPVVLQLRAEDGAGHVGYSEKISFTLPERQFSHPLAQALIEERRQLLLRDDSKQRDEAAGVMAGIAHQRTFFNDDPVVMMALRSGAMRLILSPSPETLESVTSVLWRTAVRIEEGTVGLKREALRQAQADLAASLDQEVGSNVLQKKIDLLSMALSRYLDEIVTQMGQRNKGSGETISLQMVYQDKTLTPGDLLRFLQEMRVLAQEGAQNELRDKLVQIQQIMENVKPKPVVLSPEQKKILQQFRALKKVADAQQKLQEDTARAAQLGKNPIAEKRLAEKQHSVLRQLKGIWEGLNKKPPKLLSSMAAMQEVITRLEQKGAMEALPKQDEALQSLRQGMLALLEGLPDGMGALPRHILGRNQGKDGVSGN